jgi:hypothetical protein
MIDAGVGLDGLTMVMVVFWTGGRKSFNVWYGQLTEKGEKLMLI